MLKMPSGSRNKIGYVYEIAYEDYAVFTKRFSDAFMIAEANGFSLKEGIAPLSNHWKLYNEDNEIVGYIHRSHVYSFRKVASVNGNEEDGPYGHIS